jgi:hypothetical protein
MKNPDKDLKGGGEDYPFAAEGHHVQLTVRVVTLGGRTIRFFLKYRGLQCRRGQLKGPCLRESLWLLHIPGIPRDHVTMAVHHRLPGRLAGPNSKTGIPPKTPFFPFHGLKVT